jgi:hypothetical protein
MSGGSMLDVTVIFLVAGILFGCLHDARARTAWTQAGLRGRLLSPAAIQVALGALIALGGLLYAIAFARDTPHFQDASLSLRTIRPLIAELLPAVALGLLAGIILRIGLGQMNVQLLLAGALFFILPFVIASGASMFRYIREIKTPWFEASLQSTETRQPVAIQLQGLLDRSGEAANPLDPAEYGRLLDQARTDARLDRLASGDSNASVRLAALGEPQAWPPKELVPTWELEERPAELRFAQAYFHPLMTCIWQHEGSPLAERLIREAVEPVASAARRVLEPANEQAAEPGNGPVGRRAWAEDAETLRETVEQAHAQFASLPERPVAEGTAQRASCVTRLLVPGWTGEAEHRQCDIEKNAADWCRHLPFLPPPRELARTALPYILVARLFRRVGYDSEAREFLASSSGQALGNQQRMRLMLERAELGRALGYATWPVDLRQGIDLLDSELRRVESRVPSEVFGLGCDDEGDPLYPLRVLLAMAEYERAQMRNLYAFQLVSDTASRLPMAEPVASREAVALARRTYEEVSRIGGLECFLRRPGALGAGFSMDARITYPDTYALALLVYAAQTGAERTGIKARILELLDEAEFHAQIAGESARTTFLPILDQHRRLADATL